MEGLRTDIRRRDEEVLATLGYKQEFKRDFKWPELIGLSLSVIGVVQSIAAVLVYAVPYGGPVALVWGWFVCSCFLMIIAVSLAELASAAPTSGGLYYWTFRYSPPRIRKFTAWTIGYFNTMGYISGLCGVIYSTAIQIMAAVTIGTGTFIPTTGQIYGLFCGLMVVHAFLASLPTSHIARLQSVYLLLNILPLIGLIIALPAGTPSKFKNSAKFAFGSFVNLSSWPNGFAFLLSFLAPAWTMGGIDSSVHISEEAKSANITVPRAIIASTALGCILGWVCNIVISLHMGEDTAAILSDPIGQPMATILFNSLGEKGALAIWVVIIVTLNASAMSILIAGSRQMFAFSRDGALPFSSILYKINVTTTTPVHCVLACAFGATLLGLLAFAGPVAIGAVFTMGIVCQYVSYSAPITARFFGGQRFKPGPFSLGLFSAPASFIAIVFMAFMIVILLFPTNPGPTSSTMNYSIVVLGGIFLLSSAYYLFPRHGGKTWFVGPLANVDFKEHFGDDEADHKSADIIPTN